jgi:hypothetical protein
MTDAYSMVTTGDFKSGADMEQKCSHSSLARLAGFFEGVGYLSRKRLVDPTVVMEYLPITAVWRKMKPWIMFDRERMGELQWCEFEVLSRMAEDFDAKWVPPI